MRLDLIATGNQEKAVVDASNGEIHAAAPSFRNRIFFGLCRLGSGM
jgi:hypothetical protein